MAKVERIMGKHGMPVGYRLKTEHLVSDFTVNEAIEIFDQFAKAFEENRREAHYQVFGKRLLEPMYKWVQIKPDTYIGKNGMVFCDDIECSNCGEVSDD